MTKRRRGGATNQNSPLQKRNGVKFAVEDSPTTDERSFTPDVHIPNSSLFVKGEPEDYSDESTPSTSRAFTTGGDCEEERAVSEERRQPSKLRKAVVRTTESGSIAKSREKKVVKPYAAKSRSDVDSENSLTSDESDSSIEVTSCFLCSALLPSKEDSVVVPTNDQDWPKFESKLKMSSPKVKSLYAHSYNSDSHTFICNRHAEGYQEGKTFFEKCLTCGGFLGDDGGLCLPTHEYDLFRLETSLECGKQKKNAFQKLLHKDKKSIEGKKICTHHAPHFSPLYVKFNEDSDCQYTEKCFLCGMDLVTMRRAKLAIPTTECDERILRKYLLCSISEQNRLFDHAMKCDNFTFICKFHAEGYEGLNPTEDRCFICKGHIPFEMAKEIPKDDLSHSELRSRLICSEDVVHEMFAAHEQHNLNVKFCALHVNDNGHIEAFGNESSTCPMSSMCFFCGTNVTATTKSLFHVVPTNDKDWPEFKPLLKFSAKAISSFLDHGLTCDHRMYACKSHAPEYKSIRHPSCERCLICFGHIALHQSHKIDTTQTKESLKSLLGSLQCDDKVRRRIRNVTLKKPSSVICRHHMSETIGEADSQEQKRENRQRQKEKTAKTIRESRKRVSSEEVGRELRGQSIERMKVVSDEEEGVGRKLRVRPIKRKRIVWDEEEEEMTESDSFGDEDDLTFEPGAVKKVRKQKKKVSASPDSAESMRLRRDTLVDRRIRKFVGKRFNVSGVADDDGNVSDDMEDDKGQDNILKHLSDVMQNIFDRMQHQNFDTTDLVHRLQTFEKPVEIFMRLCPVCFATNLNDENSYFFPRSEKRQNHFLESMKSVCSREEIRAVEEHEHLQLHLLSEADNTKAVKSVRVCKKHAPLDRRDTLAFSELLQDILQKDKLPAPKIDSAEKDSSNTVIVSETLIIKRNDREEELATGKAYTLDDKVPICKRRNNTPYCVICDQFRGYKDLINAPKVEFRRNLMKEFMKKNGVEEEGIRRFEELDEINRDQKGHPRFVISVCRVHTEGYNPYLPPNTNK